jgi:hypothetical protein
MLALNCHASPHAVSSVKRQLLTSQVACQKLSGIYSGIVVWLSEVFSTAVFCSRGRSKMVVFQFIYLLVYLTTLFQ